MLVLPGAVLRYECNGERKSFPIQHLMNCTIGRSNVNSIVLQDNMLSREHAIVRCSATGACELIDLGSSNGTRVNDAVISGPVQLLSGDVIQVGHQLLTFEQTDRSAHLTVEHHDEGGVPVNLENSLVTAISINVRGYAQLLQILGDDAVTRLLADVSAVACEALTKRKSVQCRHEGTATQAIWTRAQDRLDPRDYLNIFDAIAEIQHGLRLLQKHYHLLRPLSFGCGLTSGVVPTEDFANASVARGSALCEVVERAHRLELETHRTGCDVLISQSGLELFSPRLSAEGLPDLCIVSSKGFAESEPAYALRFDQLGTLSAQIARSLGQADQSVAI